MLTELTDPVSLDPQLVGWKTARLAAALQQGLPVLPGFVLHAPASGDHMRAGAEALQTRGSGGARLVVMSRPVDQEDQLVDMGNPVGGSLVTRSSSLLEGDGQWAGAFASYVGISPDELPKAVVGCWASAFSVDALERQKSEGIAPGSFEMAVLVQPELQPLAGGVAELTGDGVLTVHGVEGSPAPLLQGWVSGHSTSHRAGGWEESPLLHIAGETMLDDLRAKLARSRASLGTNRCEWATDGERAWLLQLDTVDETPAPPSSPHRADLDILVPVVRVLAAAPGPLGSELVLPWAIGGIPDGISLEKTHPVGPESLTQARELADALISQVWGSSATTGREKATTVLDALAGPDPVVAASELQSLNRADPETASKLMGLLTGVRETLSSSGVVPHPGTAWHLRADQIEAVLAGEDPPVIKRIGTTRWEPLIARVVLSCGTAHHGAPASPGLGAGPIHVVGKAPGVPPPRHVLSAPKALPNLSQLTWDSAGLITHEGSPAAHVFESTRSLGVPAVTGVDLGASAGLVAVNGYAGVVASLPETQH